MIVRSIKVENWRCFLEPIEVGPFEEGLNVLYGPNATGKSTLFEALRRALVDGHRVSGQDMEAIRPWGRSLSPSVVVEFTHDGTDYRVTKGYLDARKSVLERKEKGRFRRVAEGVAADDQVRAILKSNPPGRGLSRPENWGLAQVLWAPQGDLPYEEFSGDLLADIRTSLGVQVAGPETGPIEELIQGLYDEFYTSKGKLRSGKQAPEVVRLSKDLEDAVIKRKEALEAQREFEETARRVEDYRGKRVQAKLESEEYLTQLQEAQKQAESYKDLLAEQERRVEQVKASEAQHNELRQRIEAIKKTKKEINETRTTLNGLKQEISARARSVKSLEKAVSDAKTVLEDARRGESIVEAARELASNAERYAARKGQYEEITQRIGKIDAAEGRLADIQEKRKALIAPDANTLRSIRNAIKDRDDAQVRLDASLITLEIVPANDGSLSVIEGEGNEDVELSAGMPTQVQGAPEVVVDWSGIARLRASGPTGSIEEIRDTLSGEKEKLAVLTEPFGAVDIAQLEELNQKANDLDSRISEIEAEVGALLSDQSIEQLEQQRAVLKKAIDAMLQEHPEWSSNPSDLAQLKQEVENASRDYRESVRTAEANWEKAQQELATVKEKISVLESQINENQRQQKKAEVELDELEEDGKTDSVREKELGVLALEWEAARHGLTGAEKALSKFEIDPRDIAGKLGNQRNAAEERASEALTQEQREEGRLNRLSEEGTYLQLAQADEEVAFLEEKIREEGVKLAAIRLLHESVNQCRAETLEAVAAPVEKAATRTLKRIAGDRLGSLQLDDSFKPIGIRPEVTSSTVDLHSVSGGEQEQIYLATRLALAEVLFEDEPQLVVLDDVLTFTDSGRLVRAMKILEEAAQKLQILVLTCHPERYRALADAHFIDLEKVVHDTAG